MNESYDDTGYGGPDFDGPGFDRVETQRLLADWCNGVLTGADATRLEAMIVSQPAARRMYLEYASVEAELHAATAGATPLRLAALDAALDEHEAGPQEIAATLGEASTLGARTAEASRSFTWAAIAASLVGVATVSSLITQQWDSEALVASVAGAPDEAGRAPVVARVTATRNCRWVRDAESIGFGANLLAGQRVELTDGLAEITFDDGARVILEGPAELLIRDQPGGGAVLLSGRLSATVPPGDAEFRSPVATSRLGVSLTTSGESPRGPRKALHFGLAADDVRGEEVHVFRGAAEAFLRIEGDNVSVPPAIHLTSKEAARLRPASTTVAKFFANQDKFVRTLASTGGPQDGLYAYESFDYPDGPLSGQNGGFGWAGPWADIEAACPPGLIATNVAEPGSLAYGELRSLGGHSTQLAQQNRIRRALSTSLGGVFDAAGLVENQDGLRLVGANGQTVYLSFLQRVDKPEDGFYGVELHRGDGNANRVLCLGNGAEGAGYGVTSNYNAYGKSNYARLGVENSGVNFIVVKIEYGQQHRDLVTVYRNPESLLEERGARVDARLRGNFAFDRISLGNFDGTKRHEVDEVRIGTAYRAVTGLRDRGAERLTPRLASGPRGLLAPAVGLLAISP